jgi:hypothetical protein
VLGKARSHVPPLTLGPTTLGYRSQGYDPHMRGWVPSPIHTTIGPIPLKNASLVSAGGRWFIHSSSIVTLQKGKVAQAEKKNS